MKSKLEKAAREYATENMRPVDNDELDQFAIMQDTFVDAIKSEAAKEYWQSLTTPAGNDWKAKFHEWLSGRLDIPIPEMDLIISYVERCIASKPRTVEETE